MKCLCRFLLVALFAVGCSSAFAETPDEVKAAMKKATIFFTEKVALNGGYVWSISEDFSRRYGEIPARKSQIWVQSATPNVGMTLLDAFDATGDKFYLEAAKKTGDALVFGQRPTGGWHYMIDFDPKGLDEWYAKKASKFKWGMEEQRYFFGNATLDDGNSQSATRFLMRLLLVSKDEKYRAPLLKALDFLLAAQYPNGAFPQRFPHIKDYSPMPGFPDYTSYYTLNDGATVTAIDVLVEAWERLGDKKYLKAARRAVDFLIAVQGPEDQAVWAEQYDPETMRPIKARTHEPGGYVIRESIQVVEILEKFYKMTGDRRYLRPIPYAIAWFERLNRESVQNKRRPARYYEPVTNLPVYVLRTNRVNEKDYGLYDWPNARPDTIEEAGRPFGEVVNVAPLRAEYDRISKLTATSARAEYEKSRGWSTLPSPDRESVAKAIAAMDSRGAWVTECRVLRLDAGADGMNSGEFELIEGYSTGVFVRNLEAMIAFVKKQ